MRIDLWSDLVCPWCYLGRRRLEEALTGLSFADEVEVVLHSFELDPGAPAPATGRTLPVLARKYGRSEEEMAAGMHDLIATAGAEGLTLRLLDTWHANSHAAHRLLHLALAEAGPAAQDRLAEALQAAYFTDGRDLGDAEVLTEVAVAAGLDPARVEGVLAGTEYDEAVAADVAQARAYGITGVPFYVIDGRYGVSGAQPADVLRQVLEQARAERAAPA